MTVETIHITPTLRVRIELDEDAQNPLDVYPKLGKIAYVGRSRYVLGDEACNVEDLDMIRDGIARGELVGMPVFAYVHSGTTLKAAETNPFSCPWDSAQSGFVYMTKAEAIKEWGTKVMTATILAQALDYLVDLVDTFSSYLSGECYGFVIERLTLDEDGDVTSAEQLDSCWGFIGDINYCKDEAVQQAANFVEEDACEPH